MEWSDSLPEMLTAIGEHYGLVAVHTERRTTEVLWIGALDRLGLKSVHLHLIDPEARWHAAPSRFPFARVTQVGFGGRYERTLREFAAPRPWNCP